MSMFRKSLLLLILLCVALPAYAWQLQARVATVGGSLAVDGVAQTSVNGTKYFSYPNTVGNTHALVYTPATGYQLDKVVYENAVAAPAPANVTYDPADSVKTVMVYFKKLSFSLTTSASPGGSVSPLGTTSVPFGTAKIVTFSPLAGRNVASLSGVPAGAIVTPAVPAALNTKVTVSFTMPQSAVTLAGVFGPVNVNAGLDQAFSSKDATGPTAKLDATADPATATITWTQVGGPGFPTTKVIADNSPDPVTVTFTTASANGTYAFRATGTDASGTGSDKMSVQLFGTSAAKVRGQCASCHDGRNPGLINEWVAGNHNATGHTTGTCQRCHATEGALAGMNAGWTGSYSVMIADQATKWTPVAPAKSYNQGIQCEVCHDQHNGSVPYLRAVAGWDPNSNGKTNDQYDVCTQCHTLTDATGAVVGNYHNGGSINVTRTISDSHFDNPATGVGLASNVVEGYALRPTGASPCADCHNLHSADLTIQEAWAESAHAGKLAVKKDEAACAESITWFNTTYPTNAAAPVDACTDSALVGTSTRTVLEHFQRTTTGVAFYSSKGAIDDADGNAWTHYNWDKSNDTTPGDRTGRKDCQRCHTATGAMNFLNNPATYNAANNTFSHLSGWTATAGSPQQELLYCWGCHSDAQTGALRNPGAITENYAAATTGGPVVTVTYPNINQSNVCMGCHLGREVGQNVATDTDSDGVRSFINSHYLTAGATIFNESGYEFAGQSYDSLGYHKNVGVGDAYGTGTAGPCVTCHMTNAEPHLFEVLDTATGAPAPSLCAKCHGGLTAAVLTESEEKFHTALAELKTALDTKGIYFYPAHPYFYAGPNGTGGAFTNWTGVYGLAKWKDVMGAAFNYNLLEHDPGAYAHNRGYALKLIRDSIDFLADGAVDGAGIPAAFTTAMISTDFSQATTFAGATHPSETVCSSCHTGVNTAFANSLHGTRPGKETFYTDGMGEADPAPLQQGFGNFVNVPYSDLPCAGCHNANDNGPWDSNPAVGVVNDTWTQPTCVDCHSNRNNNAATTGVTASVENATCFGCHSRQAYELNTAAFGLTDVHISAGFKCSDCHNSVDIHGDGTADASQLGAGAITANCRNCHNDNELSTVAEHNQHLNDVDCSACHAQSMVACYNCHFDNEGLHEGVTHQKFASAKFGGQGSKSWRFLVNRVMPDGSTKVFPGSMQSLMADVTAIDGSETEDQVVGDGQGVTFVAIASYYSHSITRAALKCADCHGTATVNALASGQPVDVVKWLGADGEVVPFGPPMMAKWQGPQGVIPVPENVSLLKFDFVDVTNPAAPWNATAGNITSSRVLFKRGADVIHMPDAYVKPLTATQIQKLALTPHLIASYDADNTAIAAAIANPDTGATACGQCHYAADDPNAVEHYEGLAFHYAQYVISPASQPVVCANCHAGDDVTANAVIADQFAASAHGNVEGDAWRQYDWRSASRITCQRCHTGTGFVAKLGDETNTSNAFTPTDILKPGEVLNCSTCHSDLGAGTLRSAPEAFTIGSVSYDVVGASTLCARCHGGRETGAAIAADTDADGVRAFISPHYLTAATTLFNAGYEFAGQNYDSLGTNKTLGAAGQGPCVTCHMANGNHSMAAAIPVDGATQKAVIEAGLAELKAALEANGIHYSDVHPFFYTAPFAANTSRDGLEGTYNTAFTNWAGVYGFGSWKDVMGAAFNYQLLLNEPGAYAHNYDYALKLIDDSIDFLNDGAVNGN